MDLCTTTANIKLTLKLMPGCEGYSSLYRLTTTSQIVKNMSHFIPNIAILKDDFQLNYENKAPISFLTIKLTNVDLSELKYADSKLQEMDQILGQQLSHSLVGRHFSLLSAALIVASYIIIVVVSVRYCNCTRLFSKCGNLSKLETPSASIDDAGRNYGNAVSYNAQKETVSTEAAKELVPFINNSSRDRISEKLPIQRAPF